MGYGEDHIEWKVPYERVPVQDAVMRTWLAQIKSKSKSVNEALQHMIFTSQFLFFQRWSLFGELALPCKLLSPIFWWLCLWTTTFNFWHELQYLSGRLQETLLALEAPQIRSRWSIHLDRALPLDLMASISTCSISSTYIACQQLCDSRTWHRTTQGFQLSQVLFLSAVAV